MRNCGNFDMTTKPLTCTCCSQPAATLHRDKDGTIRLVIVSRHHSLKHPNTWTLEELQRLWHEFETETVDKPLGNVLP